MKKKLKKEIKKEVKEDVPIEIPEEIPIEVPKIEIGKLAVDYSSESLNDMARKINQIIDHINAI